MMKFVLYSQESIISLFLEKPKDTKMQSRKFHGVYVAAVTPLREDGSPAVEHLNELYSFYADQGAHGALIFGTTGEGPSFSAEERIKVWEEAAKVRENIPDFKLIAGTGTPSLEETISLNKAAFDLGFDAVLSLPPYYFRTAADEGLLDWFSKLIEESVPEDGNFMAYHFPQVCGVPLSINLLKKLSKRFPMQFIGVKDSSGDFESAKTMVNELPDVQIFVGNDMLLSKNLEIGGAGSITAASNIISPLMRRIWENCQNGEGTSTDQAVVDQIREIVNQLAPFPASMKALLRELYGFPEWSVKAPLQMSDNEMIIKSARKLRNLLDV